MKQPRIGIRILLLTTSLSAVMLLGLLLVACVGQEPQRYSNNDGYNSAPVTPYANGGNGGNDYNNDRNNNGNSSYNNGSGNNNSSNNRGNSGNNNRDDFDSNNRSDSDNSNQGNNRQDNLNSNNNGSNQQPNTDSSSFIGEARAQEIALAHAGVSADNTSYLRAHQDYDDGRAEYEVDFVVGETEYEYEIDAVSGTILSFDTESIYD